MKKKLSIKPVIVLLVITAVYSQLYSQDVNKQRKAVKLSDVKISIEKAKEVVFNHSKVPPKDAKITKIKLDKENRKFIYEIEFFTEKNKYEYNIDADTGKVLNYTQKVREIISDSVEHQKSELVPVKGSESENKIINPSKYISEDKAAEIILKRITGSEKENIKRLKLEEEEGIIVYKGKIIHENTEYIFSMDALTGDVLKWEVNEK